MKNTIPQGIIYKKMLKRKEIFIEFIASFLMNSDWFKKVDQESVTKLDKSYVTPEFMDREADLLFRLNLNGEDVYYYILIKLQVDQEDLLLFRLLKNMVAFWDDYLKQTSQKEKGALPVFVPVILYAGKPKWSAFRSFQELSPLAERFGKMALDFEYWLIDIKHLPVEYLELSCGFFSRACLA